MAKGASQCRLLVFLRSTHMIFSDSPHCAQVEMGVGQLLPRMTISMDSRSALTASASMARSSGHSMQKRLLNGHHSTTQSGTELDWQ